MGSSKSLAIEESACDPCKIAAKREPVYGRYGADGAQQLHLEASGACRGSSRSRKPSPSMLTANRVVKRKTPGKKTRVGRICQSERASARILPQDGVVGGVPAPMKDRAASRIMAVAQTKVACTISGDTMPGSRWRTMIIGRDVPAATAAST